jgi:membrane-bound ClpP family serine protease
MNAIAILFALGIVLLAFEVIVPGVILGTLGGVSLLVGCILAFITFGPTGGFSALAVAVVLIAVLLYLEFVVLPKTRWGKRMFLRATISGTSQAIPATATALVGEAAEALTVLAPSGYVQIGAQKYEAFCQSGHVPKGTALRVVSADNFRVVVTRA